MPDLISRHLVQPITLLYLTLAPSNAFIASARLRSLNIHPATDPDYITRLLQLKLSSEFTQSNNSDIAVWWLCLASVSSLFLQS